MDANWHRHLMKNRYQLRKAVFNKSCSPCSGGSNSQDSGGEVVSKNRQKIYQKLKPRRDDMLASIFDRFFLIFRAKLASWAPLGCLLAASWRHLGATCGVLGTSWGRLETSWAILGHLGASWEPLEPKNSEKAPNINLSK